MTKTHVAAFETREGVGRPAQSSSGTRSAEAAPSMLLTPPVGPQAGPRSLGLVNFGGSSFHVPCFDTITVAIDMWLVRGDPPEWDAAAGCLALRFSPN